MGQAGGLEAGGLKVLLSKQDLLVVEAALEKADGVSGSITREGGKYGAVA
jgi:hypothetical protein